MTNTVIRGVIFTIPTIISLVTSKNSDVNVEQQITNSSFCLLLACVYFLVFQFISFIINKVIYREDVEYHEQACEDMTDSFAAEAKAEEAEQRMKRAEDITVDLDVTPNDSASVSKAYQDNGSAVLINNKQPVRTSMTSEVFEVYRVVYFMGISIFVSFYTVDMNNALSGMSLIVGIMIMQIPEVLKIMRSYPSNSLLAVTRCFTLFSSVCILASIISFFFTACYYHSAPDDMVICTDIKNPKIDFLFGITLPLGTTIPVWDTDHVKINKLTLYKAAPFACCIAWVVMMFVGQDYVKNISGNSSKQVILTLVSPLFKGCAVITLLSSCMQNKRVEVASILIFILYAKEVSLHNNEDYIMKPLISGLVFSTMALAVCLIKDIKCISNYLVFMAS